MKKKVVQALVFLNSRLTPKIDNHNIHSSINSIPKANLNSIKHNAQNYAETELLNNYGINLQEKVSSDQQRRNDQILIKLQELRKTKSLRLAALVQKMGKSVNYQNLQEARQFIAHLNGKQIKEFSFTLQVLQKVVVKQTLQKQRSNQQNHTIAAALSLIEQLKQVRKIDEF